MIFVRFAIEAWRHVCEALPRRLDGLVDDRGRRERDLRLDLAGRRVEHVAAALGRALVALAVDPVGDQLAAIGRSLPRRRTPLKSNRSQW